MTGTDFTKNLKIDFDSCVYVDKERYEQDEFIKLKVGDVLITKDGTLGKVAYIDKLDTPATLNGGVFVVRDLENRVIPNSPIYNVLFIILSFQKNGCSRIIQPVPSNT